MSYLRRWSVPLLLVASLAFRLAFVAHDLRDLVTRGPLYDDSFYSFAVARNIAAGLGSTFDGIEPTNGYQPLYVLLMVPIYALCGGDRETPIYVALVVSALLNVWTGWILARLVRRYASGAAATFALVLWGFGPAIVRQAVNGLETALAMFLLAAALEYYLVTYRSRPGRRSALTLGALLGLATFARIDAGLFALALAADAWWRDRSAAGVRRLATVAATTALIIAPWCVASRMTVGSVLPESGEATRFLSAVYAPHDHARLARADFGSGPPATFLLFNLGKSVLQIGTSPVVHGMTRGLERGFEVLRAGATATLAGIGAVCLLVVLGSFWVTRRARFAHGRDRADFGFLYLYSVLLVAAYSFVVFGQIFYSRYYYPVFFFSILVGAFAFDLLRSLVRAPRIRTALTVAVLAVYGASLPYMCWQRIQNGNYRFLRVVDWIAAHTEPGATIGVFNSGAIGYFSDRRVVNLDGKVNPTALAALRAGRLPAYVEARGIDYVIDHEWIVRRFLIDGSPDAERYEPVGGDRDLGVPGWSVYQVRSEPLAPLGAAGVVSRLK